MNRPSPYQGQDPADKPILVTTFHDPDGKLRWLIDELAERTSPPGLSALSHIYRAAISVVTRATDSTMQGLLADQGIQLLVHDSGSRYKSNWLAMEAGLERDASRFHHCDMDRFLHWLLRWPEELFEAVNRIPTSGLLMYRRSTRAFSSHPATQRLTEGPANRVAANVFNIADIDLFSGSFGFGRDAAVALIEDGVRSDASFFVEAINVPYRRRLPISCWSVEGLEWETPDQYRQEIEVLGHTEWLDRFQSAGEWEFRAEMAEQWIDMCSQFVAPSGAVTVTRADLPTCP